MNWGAEDPDDTEDGSQDKSAGENVEAGHRECEVGHCGEHYPGSLKVTTKFSYGAVIPPL